MTVLTSAQRRTLRAQAHALNPVVSIAANGLTPTVLKEIDHSLQAHELIKIKVYGAERDVRETYLAEICQTLEAEPVQHIGTILIIWRQRKEEQATTIRVRSDDTAMPGKTSQRGSAKAFAAKARIAALRQKKPLRKPADRSR